MVMCGQPWGAMSLLGKGEKPIINSNAKVNETL